MEKNYLTSNFFKVKKAFFLILLTFIPFLSEASYYKNKLNFCELTKAYVNDYEPAIFQVTNNLLKKAGEYPVYCGNKIIIVGRVLDKNCMPIPDAKVYLWQVGCDGKYHYKPLRTRISQKALNLKNDTTFTGSGTATTNNEGEYNFITIYPASISQEGAYVNVRVEHRDLGILQTKLFLTSKNILRKDPLLNGNVQENDSDTIIYNFDIVMQAEGIKRY